MHKHKKVKDERAETVKSVSDGNYSNAHAAACDCNSDSKSKCCHKEPLNSDKPASGFDKTSEGDAECCHKSGEGNNLECCREKSDKKHASSAANKVGEHAAEHNCCGHTVSKAESEHACCTNEHSDSGCCGADNSTKKRARRNLIFMAVSLAALIVGYIDPFKLHGAWKLLDFSIIAIALCGTPIYISAVKSLSKGKITSSLLISVAMTASIALGVVGAFYNIGAHHGSYFFVAGEVAFLMAIGSYIENKTANKSRSAIKELIELKPDVVNIKRADGYETVDASEANIGDIILVKPNEIIGLDGQLHSAGGVVNQANITGESEPVDLVKGSKVYAGTTNLNVAIEIEVTKLSSDSTVNKLIEYVKEAEKKKAPIARIADRFAGLVVPAAIVLSIIVGILGYFAFNLPFIGALERGITVLVVFCPCALALATPTAISAGIGNAGRRGILIKNGDALESLARVNTVAFDKTGTLTQAKMEVKKVFTVGISEEELLRLVASVEVKSEHPIALALLTANKLPLYDAIDAESLVGVGMRATVDGKEILVCKRSHAEQIGLTVDLSHNSEVGTEIAVVADGELKGVIILSDAVRDSARETVASLRAMGLETIMLTGDNQTTAADVAAKIGIDDFAAGLLPEGKVGYIDGIKARGGKVLMVGDGVNDCPSLAAANCGAAMGAMGNSIAIDTAGVALMENDVKKIPFLLRLSRRVLNTIKFNIALSMALNVASIFLSAFGLLTPVTGALMHNVSSILVCANSALILTKKK